MNRFIPFFKLSRRHYLLWLTLALILMPMFSPAQAKSNPDLFTLVNNPTFNAPFWRKKIATYRKDGRLPIVDLYQAQLELKYNRNWIHETIFLEEYILRDGTRISFSANCFRSRRKGPALWLITGIHGEEPAGPNALAKNLDSIIAMEQSGIPMIVCPLLNPMGYQKNWRYPNVAVYSESIPGLSVGDSEYLLPDLNGAPRAKAPACPQAKALTKKFLELAKDYPPLLTLDLHEDNLLQKGYVYSQGPQGANDPAAKKLISLLRNHRFPLLLNGKTRFNEPLREGIVADVKDGSIDELLSAPMVILNGKSTRGPAGKSVLVLETSSMKTDLKKRTKVHATVINSLKDLWNAAF